MSRLLLIAIFGLVWLASGCTASDRDYVRNHIVQIEQQKSAARELAAAPPASNVVP